MRKLFVPASHVNHTGNSSQHMKLEQLEDRNPAHERTRPQSLCAVTVNGRTAPG